MKFGPVPVAQAAGALLAHSLLIGRRRLAKGHVLSTDDCAAAAQAGHDELLVARLEAGDVIENIAASQLAMVLAGPGCVVLPPVHGRVNLAASGDGLFLPAAGMVSAVNACDESITLATLPAFARVAAGTIVATIKTIRYAVSAEVMAAAISAARPLRIAGFGTTRVALIVTTLPGINAKSLIKVMNVSAARVQALRGQFSSLPPCPHAAPELAARLTENAADIILIAGASATVDRGDVIPQAIVLAGGTVERLGMPVDPGNLLVLGRIGARWVIGLPGCARSPKRNGFDLVLERLMAGLTVSAFDINEMGNGGLLPEAERPEPRMRARPPGRVGAVVLAAGRASRMGGPHKLLESWNDLPIICHVVDALAAAGLPPPVVVLGHEAAAVRAALAGRAAQYVEATDWAEGMGRSLAAGISAVPADWDAALVCLADMPRMDPLQIRELARAPGEVVVPVWQGRRGHPVRWPRAAFGRLLALSGDAGGKAVMSEFAVTELPAQSATVLEDIDTPEALLALRRHGPTPTAP